jgi:arylsulfatase A-like enzyme
LDRSPHRVIADQLSLPVSESPAPEEVSITTPWRLVYTAAGVRTWETEIPIRPRTLFFHRAPGDMKVLRDGTSLPINAKLSGPSQVGSWAYSTHSLHVRRPIADGPPSPGEYSVRYSTATKHEASLRFTEDDDPVSFVFQSRQLDDTSRSGLLLPAPATIGFTIDVPAGDAVLDLTPMLIPAEIADPADKSDGAVLTVSIGDAPLSSWPVSEGASPDRRVSLAQWQGQTVTLTLRTEPGPAGDANLDYVFIADPVVFVPSADPPRVVVIFLDTLRQDHLSVYGYPRATTPHLDQWAEEAAVFENARSIAPWTLPSTKTMLSGDYPEQWSSTQPIQSQLSDQGWATTLIAGNIYLSSNFDMDRGWSEHRCINWPLARVQVDRGLSYLREHPDRPVFMMLHFMDMHLPYTEPPWYRYLFAGAAPESLSSYAFHLSDVKRAAAQMGGPGKQYVRDRYDNNLRYIDDQLARFLRQLSDSDTVIVVADHGEEFWDHGKFEHGHTLYDELLRVPMIARGPSFTPGRFTEPTSLLDIAPSIAEAVGLTPDPSVPGQPLQALSSGAASAAFTARPQAFGRPLYGKRRWGSLLGDMKYTTTEGRQAAFDLSADPAEQDNIAPSWITEGREAIGEAMGTEAPIAFRLSAARPSSEREDLVAIVHVPGGIQRTWISEDYLSKSASTVTPIDDETVQVTFAGSKRSTREVYIFPVSPVEEAILETELVMRIGDTESTATRVIRHWPPLVQVNNPNLLQARQGARRIDLGYAIAPVPEEDRSREGLSDCALLATDIGELETFVETCFSLVGLGYMDEEGCHEKERELAALRVGLRENCR